MAWAFARDRGLPGHTKLVKVREDWIKSQGFYILPASDYFLGQPLMKTRSIDALVFQFAPS
jgi:hypothetical protein